MIYEFLRQAIYETFHNPDNPVYPGLHTSLKSWPKTDKSGGAPHVFPTLKRFGSVATQPAMAPSSLSDTPRTLALELRGFQDLGFRV